MLNYVRYLRESKFQTILGITDQDCTCVFALDHTHYSKWLPVHNRDMRLLPQKHPAVFAESCNGKFVIHKHETNSLAWLSNSDTSKTKLM